MNKKFSYLIDFCNGLKLKITHIYHRTLDNKWNFDNHCHNFNRIYFVLDGHGYLYNDTERVDLEPYNIYIIPANSCYNYRCEEYLEKIFIHFNLCVIPDRDLLSNVKRIVKIKSSKEEMGKIKNICYAETVTSAMFFQDYVRRLVIDIIEPYSEQITNDLKIYKKYERLYKYVEDNLYADTKVADVCSYMGFSQTYIGQQFKADTGQTIKDFMTDMLIEKMKYLFQFSENSIKEVADKLHFNNEFYCSKFFKKHIGISPKEYKRSHGNMNFAVTL